MSAVSPQVDSVREAGLRRVLCHRLGRMVNNLTMPFFELGGHGMRSVSFACINDHQVVYLTHADNYSGPVPSHPYRLH